MPQWTIVVVLALTQIVARIDRPAFAPAVPEFGQPGPALVSLAITPPDQAIGAGSVAAYQAIATFSDGTTADVTSSVTWLASPPGDSGVAGPGSIYGRSPGSIMVAAEWGVLRASASLRIH